LVVPHVKLKRLVYAASLDPSYGPVSANEGTFVDCVWLLVTVLELHITITMAQRMLLRPAGSVFVPRTLPISRSFSTVLDTPVDPATQQIRRIRSVFKDALDAKAPRTNWTKEEITEVYNTSLIDLTYASVC
jgi:hypothetical protein